MISRISFGFVAAAAGFLAYGCDSTGPNGGSAGGGACPTAPEPLFNVTIVADSGPVPSDTRVEVDWSAGDEDAFVLSEKGTWKTVAEGNVVCDVDRDAGPPADLESLVCHLWTSGATDVTVIARGFIGGEKRTLQPKEVDGCDKPVPSDVKVVLTREVDAGAE